MDAYKCRICGGELDIEFTSGQFRCGHCGNAWPVEEIDERFGKYRSAVVQLGKADDMTAEKNCGLKQLNEAIMIYKNISVQCGASMPPEIGALMRGQCKKKLETAEKTRKYLMTKEYMEKGEYTRAIKEFEALGEYEDCAALIEKCKEGAKAARNARIPYCAAVGLILPAILYIFMLEKFDMGIYKMLPIALCAAAVNIFLLYLNNGWSLLIETLSLALVIPLAIFAVLAYILHLPVWISLAAAVVIPAAVVVGAEFLGENS